MVVGAADVAGRWATAMRTEHCARAGRRAGPCRCSRDGGAPDVEIEVGIADSVGDIDADDGDGGDVGDGAEAVGGLSGGRVVVAGEEDGADDGVVDHVAEAVDELGRDAVGVEDVAGEDEDVGLGFGDGFEDARRVWRSSPLCQRPPMWRSEVWAMVIVSGGRRSWSWDIVAGDVGWA